MPLENDKKTLTKLLQFTNRLLQWTVFEADFDVRSPLRQIFERGWPDIHQRLQRCIEAIRSLKSEDDPVWVRLSESGLTGQHLTEKVSVLEWLVERGGHIKFLLRWVNSFLGSLAQSLKIAEAVKEFKEGVERIVERRRKAPQPPRHVLGL